MIKLSLLCQWYLRKLFGEIFLWYKWYKRYMWYKWYKWYKQYSWLKWPDFQVICLEIVFFLEQFDWRELTQYWEVCRCPLWCLINHRDCFKLWKIPWEFLSRSKRLKVAAIKSSKSEIMALTKSIFAVPSSYCRPCKICFWF